MLGCDGIFDRLNSINVIDSGWSAMAQALKINQRIDQGGANRRHLTIHQVTGKMADSILKSSAIERSFDNLTIVVVAFKNLQNYYESKKKLQNNKVTVIKIEGETSQSPKPMKNKMNHSLTRANNGKPEG